MAMYALGKRSRQQLQGVHPALVRVVERAIEVTAQDFSVLQGVRTLAEQRINVNKGASQTMDSRHLPGRDGYGHAVDLAAWVDHAISWQWDRYLPIAEAMRAACHEIYTPIRYGAGWFQLMPLPSQDAIKQATDAYTARCRAEGRRAFLDGGHFELPSAQYP